MTPREHEAIGLAVCCDALANLINRSMLEFRPVSAYPGEAEVLFPSGVHRDLFLVRLLDFLSERGTAQLLGTKASCLDVLHDACANKNFEVDESAVELKNAVKDLATWISEPVSPKFWLPTLDIDTRLTVTRLQLLKIAGNQAKHNPSRLTGVSSQVRELLLAHGHDVALESVPFVLEDFRAHLQDNFFIYYATWIGELLNNVWWGLQRYLEPTFHACYIVHQEDDPARYRYEFPAGVDDKSARDWFWQLMNCIRQRPYVLPFKGAHYLKEQSSLEW